MSSCGAITRLVSLRQPSMPMPESTTHIPPTPADDGGIGRKMEKETAGKAVTPIPDKSPLRGNDLLREELLDIARSKLGCRYSYAGKGPDTFDCSGFTGYVFSRKDIKLGASSRDQFTQGRKLEKSDGLRSCDLVFFSGSSGSKTVGHVGIVVDYDASDGTFTFIHAARTGVEIHKSTTPYYASRYLGARRIIE